MSIEDLHCPELHQNKESTPVFDAGAFTIPFAVTTPGESFHVKTIDSKHRRDFPSPYPLTGDERSQLKTAMADEISFVQKRKVPALIKSEGRTEATPRDYARSMTPKVGIRDIHQDGDVIEISTRPVSYPVYSELVNRDEDRDTMLDFGETTGTAAALFTADGKLVVQYRGKGNRVYGNIPGASAAGMLDGVFDEVIDNDGKRHSTGTLKPIDDAFVTKNLVKEAQEELKVNPSDMETRIIGVVHDEIKPHHEFISIAKINKTSDELAQEGLIPDEEGGHDFKERYFTIDGTPEAIAKLLIEVKCPLPTTHAAAFFMAGYELVLKEEGAVKAQEWAKKTAEGIKQNYMQMDAIVKDHYDDSLLRLKGNLRSRSGYDPNYFPEQQGLPPLLDELLRTELISQDMYATMKAKYFPEEIQKEEKKEAERTVKTAVMIDLDGPIVDPKTRKVTNPDTFPEIARLLQNGIPVMANTGRSLEWVAENIQFREYLDSQGIDLICLQNFLVVGEKGAVHYEFDEKGNPIMKTESEYSMPQDLQEAVKATVGKYSYAMFYDHTKRTMISVEMVPDYDTEQFRTDQNLLVGNLRNLLEQRGVQDKYRVSPTKIATDIEDKRVGKDLGARVILDWLKRKGLKPESVIGIGDSKEDEKMAEEAARQGIPTTFYYVGDGELPEQTDYTVINTEKKFTEATADILKQI